MSKYSQDKNYIYYQNSDVPVNKQNIRNIKILEAKERLLLLKGYENFHKRISASIDFDEKYYKQLHKKTFGDLFDFAGKYRNINISKDYTTFCQVRFLDQTSNEIFLNLRDDNFLKDYSAKPVKEF